MLDCTQALEGLSQLNDTICASLCGKQPSGGGGGTAKPSERKEDAPNATEADTEANLELTLTSESEEGDPVSDLTNDINSDGAAADGAVAAPATADISRDGASPPPTWGEKVRPLSPGSTVVGPTGSGCEEDLFMTAMGSASTTEENPLGRPAGEAFDEDTEVEEERGEGIVATSWRSYRRGPRRNKDLGSPGYAEFRSRGVPLRRIIRAVSHTLSNEARCTGKSFNGDGCVWNATLSLGVNQMFGLTVRICDVGAAPSPSSSLEGGVAPAPQQSGEPQQPSQQQPQPKPPPPQEKTPEQPPPPPPPPQQQQAPRPKTPEQSPSAPTKKKKGILPRMPSWLRDDDRPVPTHSRQRLALPPSHQTRPDLSKSLKGPVAKEGDHVVVMNLLGSGKDAEAVFGDVMEAMRSRLIRMELPGHLENFGDGDRKFADDYDLKEELNSGAQATVHRGIHRPTGHEYAVKVILRDKLTAAANTAVLFEVLVQASLSHHPNIVKLYDFFEEPGVFYLVMEYMRGGDLFDRIGSRDRYSELDARELCKNLLMGVGYCHENNIAHCDLKPKNMMLADNDDDTYIKLADFGLSARLTAPNCLMRLCGSPYYVAPEVISRKPYDRSADMWSAGVIAYLMLGGTVPFKGSSLSEIFQKVVAGEFEFSPEYWDAVSDEAKDLIRGLLRLDPAERLTASQALDSPWFKMKRRTLARRDLSRVSATLRSFDAKMKFKGIVLMVQGAQRLRCDWNYGLEPISNLPASEANVEDGAEEKKQEPPS